MNPIKILIHFAPGARGDFLAGFLLNSFSIRKNAAIIGPNFPANYKKIHHVGLHNETHTIQDIKNWDGIIIRIDPGQDAYNLVNIEVNHLKKNTDIVNDEFYYEKIYSAIKNFILIEKSKIEKNQDIYNHWIPFSSLFDIDYLIDLYIRINKTAPTSELIANVKDNIDQQLDIKQNKKLMQLVKLLEFEISNNLLQKSKNFVILDNIDQLDNFLDLNNYFNI